MSDVAPTPAGWKIVLAFACVYLGWGTTYYAAGAALKSHQLPPALFGGTRLIIAAGLLFLWQAAGRQKLAVSRQELVRAAVISLFYFLFANWFINVAQTHLESSLTAVIICSTPLWIALFSLALGRDDRLGVRGWAGLLLGLGGVVLLFGFNLREGLARFDLGFAALVVGSAVCWALGSVVSRAWSTQAPHLTIAAYQMLLGGLGQSLLGVAAGEIPLLVERLTLPALGWFCYMLLVGSLMGFVSYNWLLGQVSANQVGTYAYVNPVVAVLIGWLAQEQVNAVMLASVAVILLGVYLVRSDHGSTTAVMETEPE